MLQKSASVFIRGAVRCFHTSCLNMGAKEYRDPRFFTLYQHAKSRLLDDQRKSGVLSHKMEVKGVRLHFEMTGDGDHYVLMIPGALGSTRTDYTHQMRTFNKHDFTLVAVDPRGYGQSIPPVRDWPLEFLQRDADDVMELIRKLGIEKVSILGWSDGGVVGMIAAAQHPDIIHKLVIWGANAYITKKDMEVFHGIKDIKNWSERMRSPFLSLYGEKYFRAQWSNWVDAYQNYFDKRNGDICIAEVEKIRAKTLIVHGMKDPLVPLEHPDFLHQNIKGSKLYIMPEGKHNVHQKYPREFNFLVEHFLKQ
ncbi:valacyclovir hydrolase-like [Dreissena polymorpha]|uniref:AB hydrolase-1 domain-containing protein n=1 Tax=Dreissena polymorpha TaxID=45954 RepID=A0A9D4IEF1_DREPO|nr:valacyclovir hydrolase-like [Dreissena polymorpha]KAH3769023.1 hypothetical protein DPMN_170270 [Dreissena polymorpha]